MRMAVLASNMKCQKLQADRKSTRLNSSHGYISYAVFCLKKKNNTLASIITHTTNCRHDHVSYSMSHNFPLIEAESPVFPTDTLAAMTPTARAAASFVPQN